MIHHHNTTADDVFIRDLCLLGENNFVGNDQDVIYTEYTNLYVKI